MGAGAVKGRICLRARDSSWRSRARWSTGRPCCPRGATVVTVAHRLTTALDADRVIVLDKGRIVEEGVPAALIASQGWFAALLELEAAGWDWRSSA